MTAPATQLPDTIPLTRLTGAQSFIFTATQPFGNAHFTIDRTVNQGLNSLGSVGPPPVYVFDAVVVEIYWLPPGADASVESNWRSLAGASWTGGLIQNVKNGQTFTVNTEELSVRKDTPFDTGSEIRFNTTAATPVRIQGTIAYEL